MQFLGPKWPIFLNENLISWEIFLAITWKPDFSQACSFCEMLMNHKNFHLTKIPDKTNGMNQLQKPCFWAIFDHCWSFCLIGSFFKKSGSVTHNYIWAPNTMLWENLQTDGRADGRTEGRTDRPYFIGPFRPIPGVQWYICIFMLMFLALSICVLFISLMQLVNVTF